LLKPNICLPKDRIKINGYNFGDTQGTSLLHIIKKVYDENASRIKLWSNRQIKVKVPDYNCSKFGTNDYIKPKIYVTVDGEDSNVVKLQVMKPATCP
jgi:hypothetical protein